VAGIGAGRSRGRIQADGPAPPSLWYTLGEAELGQPGQRRGRSGAADPRRPGELTSRSWFGTEHLVHERGRAGQLPHHLMNRSDPARPRPHPRRIGRPTQPAGRSSGTPDPELDDLARRQARHASTSAAAYALPQKDIATFPRGIHLAAIAVSGVLKQRGETGWTVFRR
jgi:hypothetical protein